MKKRTPYQCTPVAARSLTSMVGIGWLSFHLASVVDTEIDVTIEDRVADFVQVSVGKADTVEIVSLAESRYLDYHLKKI